jgi:UDP-glucose 4-epimerase
MRYIVTGGAGFIGSAVTDLLIQRGHDVLVIDNLSTGKEENLNPQADFVQEDIENHTLWQALSHYDGVFHLASLARIQPSIKDPRPSHDVNVDGTFNVLEYCREHKCKLVFSSSSSIYSGEQLPSTETAPIDAKNPYTLQKLIGEWYIILYNRLYGLDYTILRYFNVFGERQILEGAYAAIVGIFLQQRELGKPLTITFDGEQRRDFTYVKDVARANVMALDWTGTYNIGTGENFSMNELADMVGGQKEYIGDREGEVRATLADITKAKMAGWSPTKTIKEWVLENS